MILVTGATGTIGREVVRQLVERNVKVRAMTRDPSKVKPGVLPDDAAIVKGDLEQPESLPAALQGVTKVFALASGPDVGKHDGALAGAAKAANVQHLVKLSAETADDHPEQLIGRWHRAGEDAIKQSGLPWTFVRPAGFMSNALNWAHTIKTQGKVYAPVGDAKSAPIDPRDIAAVIVMALTTPGHAGQAYKISGPEALSMHEQVALIGAAIDKPLTYVPVPDDVARENMIRIGMSAIIADAVLELAANTRDGERAKPSPVLAAILGRPGRSFQAWAMEHRAAFL